MSETDSFIQEVTEEVRQDRMFALWKKWGPFVLAGVAVIVGGAAYWSWTQAQQREAAELRGGTFIAADPEVLDQQTALVDKIDGPARLVAELSAAAALAEAGETEQAIERYAAIEARTDLAPEYAGLAGLQRARLLAPGQSDEALSILGGLIDGESPYRLLARELRAAVLVRAGDTAAAHEDLNAILADPAATTALRRRAAAALTATGGEVAEASG